MTSSTSIDQQPAETVRVRASDAERTATVDALQDAVTRGLLTHEEGGERMATAFAASFRDELPPLVADLPAAPVAAPTASGWRALWALLVAQVRHEVRAGRATGWRSRRFLVTALVALLLLGLVVAVVGFGLHGLFDGGGFGHDGGFGDGPGGGRR
jgi:hypothetical protein